MMGIAWTLVAAFGGGLIGSVVSAIVTLRVRDTERRDRAAEALWQYQYSLEAFSASEYSGVIDGKAFLMAGSFKEIQEAFRVAYPYAGYLNESVRRVLFREATIDIPDMPPEAQDFGDWLITADSANRLAKVLEKELDRVFSVGRGAKVSRDKEHDNE